MWTVWDVGSCRFSTDLSDKYHNTPLFVKGQMDHINLSDAKWPIVTYEGHILGEVLITKTTKNVNYDTRWPRNSRVLNSLENEADFPAVC